MGAFLAANVFRSRFLCGLGPGQEVRGTLFRMAEFQPVVSATSVCPAVFAFVGLQNQAALHFLILSQIAALRRTFSFE
jgi:hypothetical protein